MAIGTRLVNVHNAQMQNHTVRWTGLALLAITCTGWALNWAFIKLLLREWPPLFSRGVSGVAAAIVLAIIASARGESLKVPRGAWGALLLAAFTNVFAWMGFGTAAMVDLSISEGTLLVYTMPIWAMLFAWPMLGTPPHAREFAALALGIAGIAALFAGHTLALGTGKITGIALALAAAILFAFGSVRTKAPLPIAPIAQVAWQVGLGCLPMLLFGLLVEQPDFAKTEQHRRRGAALHDARADGPVLPHLVRSAATAAGIDRGARYADGAGDGRDRRSTRARRAARRAGDRRRGADARRRRAGDQAVARSLCAIRR